MVAGVRDALACGSSHRRRKARARGKRPCTRLAREQGFFCPRRLFTAKALAVFPSKGGCVPRVIPPPHGVFIPVPVTPRRLSLNP